MEKVVTNKVYNLVNLNGDKLQLRLGMLRHTRDNGVTVCVDNGWRWAFEGKKIPMPVRSRTWFNGFPEPIMLDWLKANGWHVRTIVNPGDGSAIVYDLPISNGDNIPMLEKEASAKEMYDNTISTSLEKAMKKISEAKDAGQTCCYIASGLGKPPVEVIQTLLNAGYDITYHSYNKGYGDWFVQVFWSRPCEQGKLFKGGAFEDPIEVTIKDYKNA